MRILLATAVAIAPLMIAAGARAEVVISTARTTPISTSNATGSGPDSIRLANGGSIAVTSGVAVRVDSSHNFTQDLGSAINMLRADSNVAAVLVQGGVTSNVSILGAITVTDDIDDYPDTDNDGNVDGPWATGTGRYGVRLTGPGAVVGNVEQGRDSAILVDGNQSYGISVESDLQGRLQTLGSIRVRGDDVVGIRTTGTVTGPVNLGGNIAVQGEDSVGIQILGDVTDRVAIQGAVSATGYRYTVRGNDEFVGKLDPDDLLQGGSAIHVGANIARGFIIDTPPERDSASNEPDQDGDGIPDALEGTGNIVVFGGAPAVLIGSDSRGVTLGVAGAGDDAFGFINRGQVTALGVYDDVNATGVRFGQDGGQAVIVDGGIKNSGTIATTAIKGASTGMLVTGSTSTPQIVNTGTITSTADTDGADQASAVVISGDAAVPAFENRGFIQATGVGGTATVVALQDTTGTLTSITNYRSIQAALQPGADGAPMSGSRTAIDVSANTTGVVLVQDGIQAEEGSNEVDRDGDGVPDSREPSLAGAIRLGSGADVVDIRNGTVDGDIFFGDGQDQLRIAGGAVVASAIDSGDGQLDIDIVNGELIARQQSAVDISSLNVGADGVLRVTVDPAQGSQGGFNVAGTATFAQGSELGVSFTSLIADPARFTLINAGVLDIAEIDQAAIQANSPYLFVVEAGADIPAGELFVDVRRRTADEANLITVEQQAFDPFYQALNDNDALRNAFLNQSSREGFIDLYEQMLPDHSGGPLLSLASGVDTVTRALTGRNASAAPGETSAWLQEINFYADKDKTDTYGFRSEGFGFAGGIERGTGLGAIGISTAFTSSDIKDPEAEAEEVLAASLMELGLYWRAQGQYWTTWARAAAGYASFDSTRQLVGEGLNLRTESDWNGYTLAAAGGASYERTFGRVNVRPEVYLEYFSLSEGSHSESGGGDGFDLDFDKRNGHLFSAVAAMNVGYGFGRDGNIRPELRLGWRQNISVDAGETIARFASGGPDFRLTPGTIEGGGPIIGFRLNVGNQLGMLSITGDAELLEDYVRYSLLLRASFRF